MVTVERFRTALLDSGHSFFTGVPCSHLSGPIARLEAEGLYVPASNEGTAAAMAAGTVLGGTRAAVLLQNSGLGNLVNPLTSLLMPFGIPVLFFLSLRGWPAPETDEPQHAVMGRATHGILDACGVEHWTLAPDGGGFDEVLAEALAETEAGRPAFVLVPRGAFERAEPHTAAPRRWTRRDALAVLVELLGDAAVFATTGFTSRDLFAVGDRPENFYVQGSMGHAAAIALGAARAVPERRVVVLDGDGAAVMHLGVMSTIAAAAPRNLLHVVIDNGTYESTGGQPTAKGDVDWPALARSLGYRSATAADTPAALAAALEAAAREGGPHLVALPVDAGPGAAPPRATATLSPAFLRERFETAVRPR